MIRTLLASLILTGTTVASADVVDLVAVAHNVSRGFVTASPADKYKVGDTNNYNVSMAIMKGTMVATIMAVDSKGVSVEENVDMGVVGKRNIKEVLDPADGHVIQRTVDGKEETPPPADNVQILSSDASTVTVPAGTFNCQDVKVHMKQENQDGEQWVNADEIPVGGMLKMETTTNGMTMTAELTTYSRH